ncbi:helix-turn-helix domain-containing protein [Rhodococcus marinonascens]|uniref:helix-turn-helix domain-containing protein n=1 Tax=Rhodococcus marinonascens TaxID=38311 RepID=UPI0009348F4F|nr:helix-turn-helix transcriptional regulator [Rhodococcus marinonascens]
MNKVRSRREALGLTQQDAARRAGLSLATWRRLEGEGRPSARRSTVEAVERVLKLPRGGLEDLQVGREVPISTTPQSVEAGWIQRIATSFDGDPITSRQAFKIAIASSGMEDDSVSGWDDYLAGRCAVDDLHLINRLPDWVLFTVNSHWLNRFRATFVNIGDKICRGEVPHPHCVAERVALWIAFQEARDCSDEIDHDMIDGEGGCSAILPADPEFDDAWDSAEEALFTNLDFELMWLNHFTQLISGDSGQLAGEPTGLGKLHPFRWWEQDIVDRDVA